MILGRKYTKIQEKYRFRNGTMQSAGGEASGMLPVLGRCFLYLFFFWYLLFPAAGWAEEPIFSFSSGEIGYERDGSVYRDVELLYRGRPIPLSAVEIREAYCQYRIRKNRQTSAPGNISGNAPPERFMVHVARISPVERAGRQFFRVTSPGSAVCNLLLHLRREGKNYVVQRQFNLYGRSRRRTEWERDPASIQGASESLQMPYLAVDTFRNLYTGQPFNGRYKNAEASGVSVVIYSEGREREAAVTAGSRGEIQYSLPLAEPLKAVSGYKAKNKVFTTNVRSGLEETMIITQLDFYDNYYVYDNIPQGAGIMGMFLLLTAGAILFLRRKEDLGVY